MSTPTFTETHNLVALLEKPTESDKIEQIVDFLIANPIKYALTINGKKVVVNEASIRCDLRLDDDEGTACLLNVDIFEELARIEYEKPSQKLTFYKAFFSPQWKFLIHTILQCLSAKTTAWNEFSSTMASVIFCLANNQKFNFSKYILENMVKNLEDERVGKCFSGGITPLFETMMVQAPKEIGEIPTDTQDTYILTQPSTSQTQKKHKPRRKQRKEIAVSHDEIPTEERVPTPSHDPLPSAEIEKLKKRVKKLEGKKKKRTHGLKRLYKERIVETYADEDLSLINETAQDHGRDAIVTGKEVTTIEDIKVTAAAATTTQISKDELILPQTLMEIKATKPKAKWVIIQEPSKFRATLLSQSPQAKDKEVTEGSSIRAEKELEQESAKKQKLDEQVQAKVADDDIAKLKRCLEIVPEDDDEVEIKATPLSSKSPAIVDY
nr:hypothetical protein [Tanacetum cinerariifolium]